MTRRKVKLAFIIKNSSRKAAYKKRKMGLMKMMSEISTLCGIDACAIIYSPYESQPVVWPDNYSEAHRILAQFKQMPNIEQHKMMMNQESYIGQRIRKVNEQLRKQVEDNRDKQMMEVMYQCLVGKCSIDNMCLSDLNDLGGLADNKLKEIYKRIDLLKKTSLTSEVQSLLLHQTQQQPHAVVVGGGGVSGQEVEGRVMVEGVEEGLHMSSTPHWFANWMKGPNEQNMGLFEKQDGMNMIFGDANPNPSLDSNMRMFGNKDEMNMSFGVDQNPNVGMFQKEDETYMSFWG